MLTSSSDASRFLAQSQTRLSNFIQPADAEPNNRRRHRDSTTSRYSHAQRPASRLYQPSYQPSSRPHGNPYPNTSTISGFPFASRFGAGQRETEAPLFHSALDDFQEEDDEAERDRDLAEFYALQRSRRVFAPPRTLEESGETDEGADTTVEDSRDDGKGEYRTKRKVRNPHRGTRGGIQSSWNGGSSREPRLLRDDEVERGRRSGSDASKEGKMIDIGLESVYENSDHEDDLDSEPPYDLTHDPEDHSSDDEEPHPHQSHHRNALKKWPTRPRRSQAKYGNSDSDVENSRPPSVLSTVADLPGCDSPPTPITPPYHDPFFLTLYLINLAALLSTTLLVWLHTSPPTSKLPLGDTIYTALSSSYYLLACDTLIAVIVSLLWLALLRSFIRALVYLAVVSVPVILLSFAIYLFASSFKTGDGGRGFQDKTMRWLAVVPLIVAGTWSYTLIKGRHSLHKAVAILEWASSSILASNRYLLALGAGCLFTTIIFTWLWLLCFSRAFLSGHFATSARKVFLLDSGTWLLGVWYVLVYLWTLGIISGIQRVATGAGVSQWYFHRSSPTSLSVSSKEVVLAGLSHATSTQLGTICLSSLLALLIRLPILVLPRRLVSVLILGMHTLIPSPIAALLSPLTLTYAGIQSAPLSTSARALSQMTILTDDSGNGLAAGRFLGRGIVQARVGGDSPLTPYRLAKMLLYATRAIMAVSLGFGAWVYGAKDLDVGGGVSGGVSRVKGSLYAYVVGLVAGFIGWGVLGAMEGVLVGILDGAVICYGIEGMNGRAGRYCREADWLFGGRREREEEERFMNDV